MAKDITCIPSNLSSVNFGHDRQIADAVGGQVQAFTAGATLLIGDVVYMGAAAKVLKSTTASDYKAFIGVVVGGDSFNKEGQVAIPGDVNTLGATAAVDTGLVYVQTTGIANCITAAALTIGAQVVPSGVTAGRVVAAGATAASVLGVVVSAGSATVAAKIKLNAATAIVAVGAGAVAITDATDSVSTATGSIQTAGGLGVVKALWVGGLANIAGVVTLANATDSTAINNGALIVAGGIGATKALWIGGLANIAGVVTLANATDATSKTAGGTIVSGGLAVAKVLWVGGATQFEGRFGYATGVGGAVTQGAGTGKATAFTLSKLSGQITTDNANLAADAVVSAVWTNTEIGATDVVVINHVSGGTIGEYTFNVVCGAGSATLYIANRSAGALAEALVLRYVVIKGAIA